MSHCVVLKAEQKIHFFELLVKQIGSAAFGRLYCASVVMAVRFSAESKKRLVDQQSGHWSVRPGLSYRKINLNVRF